MASGDLRFEHKDEVDQAITDWTMQHTKTEVMEAIAGEKVPCGAVYNTHELIRDEDFLSRGMMQEIEQPERGKVTVAGWPLQMSGSHVPISPCAFARRQQRRRLRRMARNRSRRGQSHAERGEI